MNEILRGEIYFANLNPVVGSEQGGRRPILVIQNNIGNKYSPTIIVATITSKMKPKLPTHLPLLNMEGLVDGSVLILEQIRTLDKRRLEKRIGRLPQSFMKLVDSALSVSLGMVNEEALVMTLCPSCRQAFYDSGSYRLSRADPDQEIKEKCTICNIRTGFDYEVVRV